MNILTILMSSSMRLKYSVNQYSIAAKKIRKKNCVN